MSLVLGKLWKCKEKVWHGYLLQSVDASNIANCSCRRCREAVRNLKGKMQPRTAKDLGTSEVTDCFCRCYGLVYSWCLVSKCVCNCDLITPWLWVLHTAMCCTGKYSKIWLNWSIIVCWYDKGVITQVLLIVITIWIDRLSWWLIVLVFWAT